MGTALHASVHLKLTKFASKKEKFRAIANKYGVKMITIRDGVYGISNKKRLGQMENMLVHSVSVAVKEFIEEEKR